MLGIIGAMDVEVKELREMMQDPQAQTVAGMTFPSIGPIAPMPPAGMTPSRLPAGSGSAGPTTMPSPLRPPWNWIASPVTAWYWTW